MSKDKINLYANIWKLYLFRIFISIYLLGPIFLAFYIDAGLSFKYLMYAQAFYTICIFLLEIPSGIIADYFGRKKTLIVATILNAFAVYLYALTNNFWVFLIAEFFWALSFVLFSGTDEALVYDTLRNVDDVHKSKTVFGRLESFSSFGVLIATPLGGILASLLSPKIVMYLMVFPYVIAFLIVITLKEAKIENPVSWDYYFKNYKSELKLLISNLALFKLIINLVAIQVLIYPIIWIYQEVFTELNLSLFYMGFIYSAWLILAIILMNNFNFFEKFFYSKKIFLIFSGIFVAIMYFVIAFSSNLYLLLIFIILGASFGLARKPLLLNYINYYIPSYKRATILSLISMIIFLFVSIIQYSIGFFSEFSKMILFIIMGLLALGFTFLSKIKNEELID